MKFLRYVLDTRVNKKSLTSELFLVQKLLKSNITRTGIYSTKFGIKNIGINDNESIVVEGMIKDKTLIECKTNLVQLKSELKSLFSIEKVEEIMITTGDVLF